MRTAAIDGQLQLAGCAITSPCRRAAVRLVILFRPQSDSMARVNARNRPGAAVGLRLASGSFVRRNVGIGLDRRPRSICCRSPSRIERTLIVIKRSLGLA